jgi:hypothetical protein
MIRYLTYSTSQYGGFRIREYGSTNWTTFSAGTSNYSDSYNGYTGQYYTSAYLTISNLLPNTTYSFEVEVNLDGTWYTRPTITITTLVGTLWEWQNPKTQGTGFNLTPTEWLAFCNKINEARVYKSLAEYSFTTSTDYIATGKDFYAWIFLQAANAINDINSQVASEILAVVSGGTIYAWYFENLKAALNNALL